MRTIKPFLAQEHVVDQAFRISCGHIQFQPYDCDEPEDTRARTRVTPTSTLRNSNMSPYCSSLSTQMREKPTDGGEGLVEGKHANIFLIP